MPDGTVLAFDFGAKRIGVATGETLLGSAHPLTVIDAESNDDRFAAIGKLVAELDDTCEKFEIAKQRRQEREAKVAEKRAAQAATKELASSAS